MSDNSIHKVVENDYGIRLGGKPNQCFYCHKYVDEFHKLDCVCITRKVKVRYSYEIEVEIPYHWDAERFEFHRNNSTWCANNSISELEKFNNEKECLCSKFKAEFLGEIDGEQIRAKD